MIWETGRSLRALWLASFLALLAGCGSATAPTAKPAPSGAQPAAAQASKPASTVKTAPAAPPTLQRVNLRLPWLIAGYDGAFVIAKDKGYYSKAGFNVSILQSNGSVQTSETVANGSDTFGFADAGTVATLISKGAPIKAIGALVQQSPSGFMHDPGVQLTSVAQLKGRTVFGNPSGTPSQLLPAVLHTAGMTKADIHYVVVSPHALPTAILKTPGSVATGFSNATFPPLLKVDPKAEFTPYAKFGINTISLSLITSLKEISRHPGAVRRFVAASIQGWEYARAHPKQTVQATLKAFPHANAFILRKSLAFTAPLTHTAATKGKPVGWMAAGDWRQTLQLLHHYAGLTKILPLNRYYTNQFVPAGP